LLHSAWFHLVIAKKSDFHQDCPQYTPKKWDESVPG
jgi:hypothetical protein